MQLFGPKVFWTPIFLSLVKNKSQNGYLGEKISILHKQMTEKLSFEVNLEIVKNPKKMHFLNAFFLHQKYFELQFFYPK